MYMLILVAAVMLLLYVWALNNPFASRTVVAELKRRWRLRLIMRHGSQAAQRLVKKLRTDAAKKRFDKKLVDEVIETHRQEIIERLGKKEADARLGEPTTLERYF